MRPMITTAVLAVLLTAGCATGQAATREAQPSSSSSTPRPSIYTGQAAGSIASHITGCQNVQPGQVGKGGPDLASTATCTLDGRTLVIDSWASTEAAGSVERVLLASGVEAYFAQGEAWTVHVGDDPTLQMQLTNDAAGLIEAANDSARYPAADLPGQQSAAAAVVAAIGGSVVHVPA